MKATVKGVKQKRFEFISFELALKVRETVYLKLIAFDANEDE